MRDEWVAPPFKVDESNEQRCDGNVEGKVRMIDTTRLSTPDQKLDDQEKNMGSRVRKQMRRHRAGVLRCTVRMQEF
jgi:hypothetical protein